MAKKDAKPMSQHNNYVYEDFEPTMDWVQDAGHDTLLVYIPGFRKEQLKVQVTSFRKLRIMGERPVDDNKCSRFYKEHHIPSNYDTNQIIAKVQGGILYIKHPKKVTSSAKSHETANSSAQTAELQKPINEPEPKLKSQKKPATHQEVPPKTNIDEQNSEKVNNGIVNADATNTQKLTEKEKELNNVNGKNTSTTTMDTGNFPKKTPDYKKSTDGLDQVGNVMNKSENNEGFDGHNTGAMITKEETASGSRKTKLPLYKQVLEGLMTEMKKPRKSTNIVVAGFLVLVLGIYVKNAIRSRGESEN